MIHHYDKSYFETPLGKTLNITLPTANYRIDHRTKEIIFIPFSFMDSFYLIFLSFYLHAKP